MGRERRRSIVRVRVRRRRMAGKEEEEGEELGPKQAEQGDRIAKTRRGSCSRSKRDRAVRWRRTSRVPSRASEDRDRRQ